MTDTTTEPAVDPETEPPVDPDEAELDPVDDGTDLDETAPEPDPVERDEEPSAQATIELLEREERRHRNAVAKALGIEPEQMHECPTCEAVGYTPEPIDAPPPLVQDPYTETCPRCQGNGETLSGATSRALYTIPCNGCSGSGYVQKVEQPAAGADFGNGAPPAPSYVPPAIANEHDAAQVAALRAQGYTILEPITVPSPVPA